MQKFMCFAVLENIKCFFWRYVHSFCRSTNVDIIEILL